VANTSPASRLERFVLWGDRMRSFAMKWRTTDARNSSKTERRMNACSGMTIPQWFATCGTLASFALPALAAIDIQFDYTYDTGSFFVGHPERQSVLEAAALTFESRITDNLTAITPGGVNTWTAIFDHPSTGVQVEVTDPTVAAGVIRVYIGARNLPNGTLGIGGPGGLSAGGTQPFLDSVLLRGQVSGTTDFGPWGGSITFDNDASWYFDSNITNQEPFGSMNDFYSVSLHELGHLLGMGTAPSWTNSITGNNFTGAASMAENGGLAVPLTTPDHGHWANGTQSEVLWPMVINPQEAAMDPSIFVGTRKYFTELDFAGLDDIGWQVIPEPTSAILMGTAGVLVMSRRRRA
jgi:hypothetical protein